jgi:alkylation response protein AidB-like acyl-CoA dehydrogenase
MWRRDDELQAMLRDSVEAFAESEHGTARFRACRAGVLGFDLDVWSTMGGLGWTGVLIDEARGGAGLGLQSALTIAHVFGRRLIPEPFVASAIMAATVLAAAGEGVSGRLATDLAAGRSVVTLAFQEEAERISSWPSRTRLVRRTNGYELTGAKVFVPAWGPCADILVTAELDGEAALVALRPDTVGLGVAARKMADGLATADLTFDRIVIGADALLGVGPAVADAIERAVARGQIAVSAMLEGVAETLLRNTIDHVNRRVQFGKPLAHFQALRHGLVDLYMEIELTGASWRRAAAALEEADTPVARAAIAAAKSRASDTALRAAGAAIQYHGAFGYTEEADVGLYANAALRWANWLGSATAQRAAVLSVSTV